MRKLNLIAGTVILVTIASWWLWEPVHKSSPAARWIILADTDGDGRLSPSEYSRVSDDKTPMDVIDVTGNGFIESEELEGFFLGVDPVDLIEIR